MSSADLAAERLDALARSPKGMASGGEVLGTPSASATVMTWTDSIASAVQVSMLMGCVPWEGGPVSRGAVLRIG